MVVATVKGKKKPKKPAQPKKDNNGNPYAKRSKSQPKRGRNT